MENIKVKKGNIVFKGLDLKRSKELISVKKAKYKKFIEKKLKSIESRKLLIENIEKKLNIINSLNIQDSFLEGEYKTLLRIFKGEVMDSKNKEFFKHPVYLSFSLGYFEDLKPIDERLAGLDERINLAIRGINIHLDKLKVFQILYKAHYEAFVQLYLNEMVLDTGNTP